MFDAKKLLDQFLGSGVGGGKPGGVSPDLLKGLAGGAAVTGLAGLLLGGKGIGKLASTVVKTGGTVAIAGLAYKAFQTWQEGRNGAPPAATAPEAEGTAFLPSSATAQNDLSLGIIRAMIAAAKSDGHIDAAEQAKIFGRLDTMSLDTEAKAFVMDELRKPLDIDAVVAAAATPEAAIEIYAASVLAIDADDPAEQAYLAMLASRLKLDPGLKASVEAEAAKA